MGRVVAVHILNEDERLLQANKGLPEEILEKVGGGR